MRNRKMIAAAAMSAALAGGAVVGATLGNPLASGAAPGSTPAASTTTTAPDGSAPQGPGQGGERGPRGPRGGMDLEVAAKTLKMTVEELRTELQAGKSLADVAKAQGVSRQDLVDALVKAGEARLDEAKKALPDTVDKMVDATHAPGDHEGPDGKGGGGGLPGRGGMRGAALEPAAKALGMTTDELRTALEDDKTLAEVAKDKGVDAQKVIDALVAEAKTHLDEAVADGHLTQEQADKALDAAKTAITSWVNDGKPAGMGPMGGPGRGGPGGGGPGGMPHN